MNRTEPIQSQPAQAPLPPGGRVLISSQSGTVTVTGWDNDFIQATAAGDEEVTALLSTQESGERTSVTVSARRVDVRGERRARDVMLDIKVPKRANVETVGTSRSDFDVSDVEGSVAISTSNGDVRIRRSGPVKVTSHRGDTIAEQVRGTLSIRAMSGDVLASDVTGNVDVSLTGGDISVSNAGGDVRANTVGGDISIICAKGRVDSSTASGSITLVGAGGNVDASTVSGDVSFTGSLRPQGRYRLKTVSGEVMMRLPQEPPGFTATLATYSGEIETDFQLRLEGPVQSGTINKRLTGRYGDGDTRIALDSFSGSVRIVRAPQTEAEKCR